MKSKYCKKVQARLVQIQELFQNKERTEEIFRRIGKPDGTKYKGSELHNTLEAFYMLINQHVPDLLQEVGLKNVGQIEKEENFNEPLPTIRCQEQEG